LLRSPAVMIFSRYPCIYVRDGNNKIESVYYVI